MAEEFTRIAGRLLADEAVSRRKLCVSLEGDAVIARIVEGLQSGIKTKSSTGADDGTGDVILELDWALVVELFKPVSEPLAGEINGINKVFSTSFPYEPGTLTLYRCGLKYSEFTEVPESDTLVELAEAPLSSGFVDTIEVVYLKKVIQG